MASARVSILQSQQEVRVARSAEYPALTVGANIGRNYSNLALFAGNNYALTLGVTIPIFNGFGHQYDLAAAKSRVDEQRASANVLRTQVSSQVVTSYVNLHTAAARVRTAECAAREREAIGRGRAAAATKPASARFSTFSPRSPRSRARARSRHKLVGRGQPRSRSSRTTSACSACMARRRFRSRTIPPLARNEFRPRVHRSAHTRGAARARRAVPRSLRAPRRRRSRNPLRCR